MRQEFEELYNTYLGLSHEEKINAAKYGAYEVYKYFNEKGADNKYISGFLGALIAFFIGADRQVTQQEVDIYNGVFETEFTAEELMDYIKACSEMKHYFSLNRTFDEFPLELKKSACLIPLVVVVADGKITEEEADLFEELWYQ